MPAKKPTDLDAHHYRNNSEQQYARAHELLVPELFEETDKVLDVGCGDGRISADIADWVPKGRVVGVDSSSNMIRLAQASFPTAKFPNLEFCLGKAEELSFEEQFDKIVCFNCLLWVREPKRALEKMCAALKPGGKLFILTYLKESSYVDFFEETLINFPQYKKFSAAYTMLSVESYKNILQSNKLELEKCVIQDLISIFKSREELRDYIKGWLCSYVPIPEEIQESFLDLAIENAVLYSAQNINVSINIQYKSLIIQAKNPD